MLHPRLLQPPVLPLVLPMLLLPLVLHPRLLQPPVLRLVLSTLLLPLGLSQDPLRRLVPHAPLVLPRLLPLQPLCSAKGYMVKRTTCPSGLRCSAGTHRFVLRDPFIVGKIGISAEERE